MPLDDFIAEVIAILRDDPLECLSELRRLDGAKRQSVHAHAFSGKLNSKVAGHLLHAGFGDVERHLCRRRSHTCQERGRVDKEAWP
jgi:hypothetical protein